MKITVVGSYRDEERLLLDKPLFEQACKVIGEHLAKCGHTLIVPHDDMIDTAETYALRGFMNAGSKNYYKCFVHSGDPALKAHFEAVEKSDAVILVGGLNGTYAAGLGALRYRKLIVPIPAFGGSAKDLCEIPEIDKAVISEIRNLDCKSEGWEESLSGAINKVLDAYPRVLIIHGRGDAGEELQERVSKASKVSGSLLSGLASPVIMDLRGKGALSVPDVFESLGSNVSAAIAIVTADDIGGFARSDDPSRREYSARELTLKPRARENVWVEVGWFWGRLGRSRVLIWLKEEVQLPSDLQGAAWTQGTLDQSWPSIEAFLGKLRHSDIESFNSMDFQIPTIQQKKNEPALKNKPSNTTTKKIKPVKAEK
jgi:hypothetical protein